jgi:hypothetical protein
VKRAWTSAVILPGGGSLTLLGVATTTNGVIVEAEGPGVGALSELSPPVRRAPQPAACSWEKLLALGYVGSYAGLAKLLAPGRHDGSTFRRRRAGGAPLASVFTGHVSPQIAAALLSQPRRLLSARQVHTVDALKERCPGFTTIRRLVLSFRTILRVGTVPTLRRWLMRAEATKIEPLQRFVGKLRQDLGAVEGAVL